MTRGKNTEKSVTNKIQDRRKTYGGRIVKKVMYPVEHVDGYTEGPLTSEGLLSSVQKE